MATEAKGWNDVAASVVACALLAPLTTGAVPTAEAMTELTAFVTDAEAVSVSTMVNVVVTVVPGETWWTVGLKTSRSMVDVTAAAEPVMVYKPAAGSYVPRPKLLKTPLALSESLMVTVSV